MQKSQVIPFHFETREVRTLLIDDQPWFVAADVCQALDIRNNRDAIARLDDDERGVATTDTPSGQQDMGVINQSGLYSLILTSRKAEAKRFKKWITAEVLPAIRRHGRYEDHRNQMATLVGEALGVTELTALKGVIADKAKLLPKEKRLSFMHTMHHRLHTRFNVARTELIPHKDFADACNFVVAYALEGEWIPGHASPTFDDWMNLNALISCMQNSYEIFARYNLYQHLTGLGSRSGIEIIDFLRDGRGIAGMLARQYSEPLARASIEARRIASTVC